MHIRKCHIQESKSCKVYKVAFLLFELDQAIRNGKYKPKLRLYARDEVLIIDEFLLNLTT